MLQNKTEDEENSLLHHPRALLAACAHGQSNTALRVIEALNNTSVCSHNRLVSCDHPELACALGEVRADVEGQFDNRNETTGADRGLTQRPADLAAVVNLADADGSTPLVYAAKHGLTAVVRQLLSLGADIDARVMPSRNGALHLAAVKGVVEPVRLLVQALHRQGNSVDVTNVNNDTPLMFACGFGHIGVTAVLLQAGAMVSAANASGLTPLLAAAGGMHHHVAQALLRHCSKQSAASGDSSMVSRVLQQRDENGNGPLHFACRAGDVEGTQLLLDHGCSISERNAHGRTPVQEARLSNQHACQRLLEDHCEIVYAKVDSTLSQWAPSALNLKRPNQQPKHPSRIKHQQRLQEQAVVPVEPLPTPHQQLTAAEQQHQQPQQQQHLPLPLPEVQQQSAELVDPCRLGPAGYDAPRGLLNMKNGITTNGLLSRQPSTSAQQHVMVPLHVPVKVEVELAAHGSGSTILLLPVSSQSSGYVASSAQAGPYTNEISSTSLTTVGPVTAAAAATAASNLSPRSSPLLAAGLKATSTPYKAAVCANAELPASSGLQAKEHSLPLSSRLATATHSCTLPGSRPAVQQPARANLPVGTAQPSPYISGGRSTSAGRCGAGTFVHGTGTTAAPTQRHGRDAGVISTQPALLLATSHHTSVADFPEATLAASAEVHPSLVSSMTLLDSWASWHATALSQVQLDCTEAAALDVQPGHVLGLGLDSLSMSQLEALEGIHHRALARLADARLHQARDQERLHAAEKAQLAAELQAVTAHLQSKLMAQNESA